jgi:hypothetical protein
MEYLREILKFLWRLSGCFLLLSAIGPFVFDYVPTPHLAEGQWNAFLLFLVLFGLLGGLVRVTRHWHSVPVPFGRIANQTKLWLAGGVVAVLMFGAGIFWALCGVR